MNKVVAVIFVILSSITSCKSQPDNAKELRRIYIKYFQVFLEESNSSQIRTLDSLRVLHLNDSLYTLQIMHFNAGHESDILTFDYGASEESLASLKVLLIDVKGNEYLICYDVLLSDVSGKDYLENICIKVKISFFEGKIKIHNIETG